MTSALGADGAGITRFEDEPTTLCVRSVVLNAVSKVVPSPDVL